MAEDTDPRVERTRKRVIDAALELMRQGGPAAITFSSLSEASGVGRATLYRHWPTLDGLWPELLEAAQSAEGFEITGDLRTDLRTALGIVANNVRSAEGRVGFVAMLERAQWDEETRRLADHAEEYSPVSMVLRRALAEGRLPATVDPAVASSLLVGPLMHRSLLAGGELTGEFLDEVVDAYLLSRGVD